MLYEYQIIYRTLEANAPNGPVQTFVLRAEKGKPEKARALAEQIPGIKVEQVLPWQPVIDWSQQTFDREEAAVYLRKSASGIDKAMAEGLLPKATTGYPIFTRRMLDELIERVMKQPKRGN